ncbi:hypothetical protein G6F16_000952 [Rhizopus arrhizus]|nr:hypothetical protein G6F19_000488 [Rhizopus arrhizus]KAG0878376.1 hypothetical protein G6F16_000952 [Rhizopus arrhizus]
MLLPLLPTLVPQLLHLFRVCWQWSYTLLSWRVAQVVPIHKKGSKTDLGNFRPISLTSTFRKLFEKCLYPSLLEQSPTLDIAQGEFRESRSFLDQFQCLIEICSILRRNHNSFPTLAFLDIKSTYDTVDRSYVWCELQSHLCPALLVYNAKNCVCCNQLNTAPKYLTDILPQRWLAFWSLHLTATQRNVIYRLINKKIPHKDILHKFFPDKFDTPNCSFCASTVDSLQHFLFDCPVKQVVWQGLVREFLWPTVDTQDIFKAFTTLDYYSVSYCQSADITAESVLIIALGQVWKCHWQSVFNQQPFLSSTVLQAIRNNVQQHIAEEGDLD